MTQVNSARGIRGKSALRKRAGGRTLAQRRADLEAQVRNYLRTNALVALTELDQVKARLKDLHERLERHVGHRVTQLDIATEMGVPYRTFQSWENGEVETEAANYDRIAAYYTKRLDRTITRNYILFGGDDEPALASPDGDSLDDVDKVALERIQRRLDQIAKALNLPDLPDVELGVAAPEEEMEEAVGEVEDAAAAEEPPSEPETGEEEPGAI